MFTFTPTPLEGAYLVQLPNFSDERGSFIKTFNNLSWLRQHLKFSLKESYFSLSKRNVIRGMHFQLPPAQHSKIVFCPSGSITDVILDLRKKSTTFGKYFSAELSAENNLALFIPEGFAHGFKSLTEDAMTYYLVSSEYNREKDSGIRWDSFGMDWELRQPIISERDHSFVTLNDFNSPF